MGQIRQIYRERQFMKEYKKAQEKAQLHGVVNDAYDRDKKQNTQSQNSNDYPKQEYKMDSIHDKIESVHETDQNDLDLTVNDSSKFPSMHDVSRFPSSLKEKPSNVVKIEDRISVSSGEESEVKVNVNINDMS